jgi:GNAT superfamily N-acetyltransferase
VFAAAPADVGDGAGPPDLRIERLTPANIDDWLAVRAMMAPDRLTGIGNTREFAAALAAAPHIVVVLAYLDGAPAATAWLWHGHRTAWLRGASVAPQFRGRGIHRALIAARAKAAIDLGCDLIGAWAAAGSTSSRNLGALGLRRIGTRQHYRYVPASLAAAAVSRSTTSA